MVIGPFQTEVEREWREEMFVRMDVASVDNEVDGMIAVSWEEEEEEEGEEEEERKEVVETRKRKRLTRREKVTTLVGLAMNF